MKYQGEWEYILEFYNPEDAMKLLLNEYQQSFHIKRAKNQLKIIQHIFLYKGILVVESHFEPLVQPFRLEELLDYLEQDLTNSRERFLNLWNTDEIKFIDFNYHFTSNVMGRERLSQEEYQEMEYAESNIRLEQRFFDELKEYVGKKYGEDQ